MSDETFDSYIAGIDPRFVPLVEALDGAVRAAHPDFDTRISYRMLMYALAGDFRHWVCAIGVTSKAAQVRFLYGTLLDDPPGRLRAGTSHLANLDFTSAKDIDAAVVTAYVGEAVSRHEEFKAVGEGPGS